MLFGYESLRSDISQYKPQNEQSRTSIVSVNEIESLARKKFIRNLALLYESSSPNFSETASRLWLDKLNKIINKNSIKNISQLVPNKLLLVKSIGSSKLNYLANEDEKGFFLNLHEHKELIKFKYSIYYKSDLTKTAKLYLIYNYGQRLIRKRKQYKYDYRNISKNIKVFFYISRQYRRNIKFYGKSFYMINNYNQITTHKSNRYYIYSHIKSMVRRKLKFFLSMNDVNKSVMFLKSIKQKYDIDFFKKNGIRNNYHSMHNKKKNLSKFDVVKSDESKCNRSIINLKSLSYNLISSDQKLVKSNIDSTYNKTRSNERLEYSYKGTNSSPVFSKMENFITFTNYDSCNSTSPVFIKQNEYKYISLKSEQVLNICEQNKYHNIISNRNDKISSSAGLVSPLYKETNTKFSCNHHLPNLDQISQAENISNTICKDLSEMITHSKCSKRVVSNALKLGESVCSKSVKEQEYDLPKDSYHFDKQNRVIKITQNKLNQKGSLSKGVCTSILSNIFCLSLIICQLKLRYYLLLKEYMLIISRHENRYNKLDFFNIRLELLKNEKLYFSPIILETYYPDKRNRSIKLYPIKKNQPFKISFFTNINYSSLKVRSYRDNRSLNIRRRFTTTQIIKKLEKHRGKIIVNAMKQYKKSRITNSKLFKGLNSILSNKSIEYYKNDIIFKQRTPKRIQCR